MLTGRGRSRPGLELLAPALISARSPHVRPERAGPKPAGHRRVDIQLGIRPVVRHEQPPCGKSEVPHTPETCCRRTRNGGNVDASESELRLGAALGNLAAAALGPGTGKTLRANLYIRMPLDLNEFMTLGALVRELAQLAAP